MILKPGTRIIGIDDSKKLDSASREELAKEIKEKAASWSVAFVEVEEVDTINIYWAGLLAMQRVVQGVRSPPQLLIDAKRLKEIPIRSRRSSKATLNPPASPLPLFLRKSRAMRRCGCSTRVIPATALQIPVRAHYAALSRLGACAAHRRSFGPVRKVLGLPPLPPWPLASERVVG